LPVADVAELGMVDEEDRRHSGRVVLEDNPNVVAVDDAVDHDSAVLYARTHLPNCPFTQTQ